MFGCDSILNEKDAWIRLRNVTYDYPKMERFSNLENFNDNLKQLLLKSFPDTFSNMNFSVCNVDLLFKFKSSSNEEENISLIKSYSIGLEDISEEYRTENIYKEYCKIFSSNTAIKANSIFDLIPKEIFTFEFLSDVVNHNTYFFTLLDNTTDRYYDLLKIAVSSKNDDKIQKDTSDLSNFLNKNNLFNKEISELYVKNTLNLHHIPSVSNYNELAEYTLNHNVYKYLLSEKHSLTEELLFNALNKVSDSDIFTKIHHINEVEKFFYNVKRPINSLIKLYLEKYVDYFNPMFTNHRDSLIKAFLKCDISKFMKKDIAKKLICKSTDYYEYLKNYITDDEYFNALTNIAPYYIETGYRLAVRFQNNKDNNIKKLQELFPTLKIEKV
jgi:hypothetical protein